MHKKQITMDTLPLIVQDRIKEIFPSALLPEYMLRGLSEGDVDTIEPPYIWARLIKYNDLVPFIYFHFSNFEKPGVAFMVKEYLTNYSGSTPITIVAFRHTLDYFIESFHLNTLDFTRSKKTLDFYYNYFKS